MPVQAGRKELRKHVDLVEIAVDAVTDGNIDESVFAGHGYGRLGALGGEREEPRAAASAENYGQYRFHGESLVAEE
jgi:hypothetical protein